MFKIDVNRLPLLEKKEFPTIKQTVRKKVTKTAAQKPVITAGNVSYVPVKAKKAPAVDTSTIMDKYKNIEVKKVDLPMMGAGATIPSRLRTAEQKQADDLRQAKAMSNSAAARFMYGAGEGLHFLGHEKKTEVQKDIKSLIDNTSAGKAGKITGQVAQFAGGYAVGAAPITSALRGVQAFNKLNKVGQGVARSVALDTAVGLPLNTNIALNKEGLRGEEAAKNIALNTAIDLVAGGALEIIGGVLLKSGRKVATKSDFDALPASEKGEVLTEIERLAYESNVRKGKITPQGDTLYGNAPRPIAGELPAPQMSEKLYYHGTNAEFDSFDMSKINSNEPAGDYVGKGIFFAGDPEKARRYGNIVKSAHLDLKNPLVINTKEDINNLYDLFGGMVDYVKTKRTNPQLIQDKLKSVGYDGLVDNLYDQYAVFDARQIGKPEQLGEYVAKINKEVPRTITPNELPRATSPRAGQVLPRASDSLVQPRTQVLGADVPREQTFTQKPKYMAEDIGGNVEKLGKERGFSENIATDKAMEEPLQKSFRDAPDTYEVLSNKETLRRAEEMLSNDGAKTSYDTVIKAIASNDLKPEHIPLARKVANQLAKEGDTEGARTLLSEIAVKLTESGQLSQSARILRNSDPMSVLQFIEKTIAKTNLGIQKRIKGFKGLKLTDDEIKRLADIDVGDEDAIAQAVSDIGKRLAKEIPSTWFEKFDELRRIAMLGNFKTQARNVVGNVPIMGERKLSNKVSAVLQKTLPKEQRTQALFTTKESRKLAKELYEMNEEYLLSTNKWDTSDIRKVLNEEREVFGQSLLGKATSKLGGKRQNAADNVGLEGTRKLVYSALQKGDAPFLKSAFVDRMASYVSAQGYKSLDEVPQKALDLAREEALKATFRDANGAARFINDVKRKGGLVGKITEATIPFVTTPTNLVRRAIDYSPAGLIRSLAKMKKADDVPKVIDEMAQGLTGTGLLGIGVYLAHNGILVGSADENKKKSNYERATGKIPFSIQTPWGSVSYEWAQPFGSQLAMAAEMYKGYKKATEEEREFTAKDVASIMAEVVYAGVDVTLGASVYQNVVDLLSGYGSIGERITENLTEYPTQVIPTLLGQLARAGDPYVRNAFDKTDKTASYANRILSRVPGKSDELPIKYDVWGRPVKRADNMLARAGQELLNPANVLGKNETALDKEIISLYNRTGSNDVFPKVAPYNFSEGGQRYELNNKDLSEFQKNMGEYARKEVNRFINTAEYRQMSDADKVKAISKIYDDASDEAKMTHLESKGVSPIVMMTESHQEKYKSLASPYVTPRKYMQIYEAQKSAGTNIEKAYAIDKAMSNLPAPVFEAFGIKPETASLVRSLKAAGITVEQYTAAKEKADANNSGRVGKDEAIAYLGKQNLSRKQKFILTKSLTTLKDKNNPYR